MKQSSDLVALSAAILDLALITLAFFVAFWLRFDSFERVDQFIWLYYFSAPLCLFLLLRYGVMGGFRYQPLKRILVSTLKAFVIVGFVSSNVLYLSKTADYSRLLFGLYFSLATGFVLAEKLLLKKLFERFLRRGRMNVRIALVGFGEKFDEILHDLQAHPQWGIEPALVIDPREDSPEAIATTVRSSVIDEVYLAYPRGADNRHGLDDLLQRFEQMGFPVRVTLNFDELQAYYGQFHCLMAGKPGVLLSPYNLDPDQLITKRLMDVVGASIGLLILALITPLIALAIRLDSPGPVFFSQLRVGKGGREFRMYKFRTMYTDAEDRLPELLHKNVHRGPLFKMQNDPRVTRVGRWLRRHSVDEFPQFLNVLLGDMSLVGVRPPTVAEVAQYKDHHFLRISFRPGLTGLWQVSGRNIHSEFENVLAIDAHYIRNWGIWLDVKIILRTIGVILFPAASRGM